MKSGLYKTLLLVLCTLAPFAINTKAYADSIVQAGGPEAVQQNRIGENPNTPLPVKLVSLTASVNNGFITVEWRTENEQDNDHFDIEISSDAKNYKKFRTVPSKGVNGNSDIVLDYKEMIDLKDVILSGLPVLLLMFLSFQRRKTILRGGAGLVFLLFLATACRKEKPVLVKPVKLAYIRLLQVDKDGTKSYSAVRAVTIPE